MARFLLVVLLLAAPTSALLRGSGAADDSGDNVIDIDQVQNQLSSMLAKANDRLSTAEEHHKKILDQARSDIMEDFDTEAGELGDAVTKYEAGLIVAETRLEAAINMSKAGVAQAAKSPGANDWQGPTFTEKAKLSAQVSAAERNLRHMRRQRASLIHSALSRSEEPLEDETEKLGMLVGDLSKDMDAAKERIEDTVDLTEISGNMTRDALKTVPKVKAEPMAKTAKEEESRLQSLEKGLDSAMKDSKAAAAEATAALNLVLANETKQQKAKSDSVSKEVKDAEHQEVSSVGGQMSIDAEKKVMEAKKATAQNAGEEQKPKGKKAEGKKAEGKKDEGKKNNGKKVEGKKAEGKKA